MPESSTTRSDATAGLTAWQRVRAQQCIYHGISSPNIAIDLGVGKRQVQNLRDGGPRGAAKQMERLFGSPRGILECTVFLSRYVTLVLDPVKMLEPPMSHEVDLDAVIAVHSFLRTAMHPVFFKVLDINSAIGLIRKYADGELQLRWCRKRFEDGTLCGAVYPRPSFGPPVADCPICTPPAHGWASLAIHSHEDIDWHDCNEEDSHADLDDIALGYDPRGVDPGDTGDTPKPRIRAHDDKNKERSK